MKLAWICYRIYWNNLWTFVYFMYDLGNANELYAFCFASHHSQNSRNLYILLIRSNFIQKIFYINIVSGIDRYNYFLNNTQIIFHFQNLRILSLLDHPAKEDRWMWMFGVWFLEYWSKPSLKSIIIIIYSRDIIRFGRWHNWPK